MVLVMRDTTERPGVRIVTGTLTLVRTNENTIYSEFADCSTMRKNMRWLMHPIHTVADLHRKE